MSLQEYISIVKHTSCVLSFYDVRWKIVFNNENYEAHANLKRNLLILMKEIWLRT